MQFIQSFIAFIGRALLSIIFISSAIHKIADWQDTLLSFNQAMTDWLAVSIEHSWIVTSLEWGLDNASTLLLAAAIMELVGGLLVFLGIWVRLGAFFLLVFLLPVTLVFHHFWDLQGVDRQMQMVHFMKNLSISGGLMFLLGVGKGRKCVSSGHDQPA
jgi:putative oxidoreductase